MANKIIFINNLYSPYAVGGAERVVERRAREAVDRGDDVVIITTAPWRGWGSWKSQEGSDGDVVIYRFWAPNLCFYKNLNKHNFVFKLLWHFIDLFNFWSGKIVLDILEKEKPNIVEIHNLMGIGYSLKVHIVLKSIKSTIKIVLYLHDVQLVEPSGVLAWNHEKDNLMQKIYSWIMKKKFRNVDEVISPTEFLKDFYKDRGFFENAELQIETHCNVSVQNVKQISDSNIKFLFVGSLVEHKGVRVLMEAWDLVCHPCPVSLHIIGDGILRQEILEWSKNHPEVIIHGRLEGEKLDKIYNECDVLIFPSICIENNPTVIHEALHHGLRVIASDTGGIKEIFGEVEKVELVEAGNVGELLDVIKNIKSNI